MKILYGVPGEGMGHATRSKVIITHLLENHDVRIVSSNRAFEFLNKQFPNRVYEIKGLNFVYKDGGIEKLKTLQSILKKSPHDLFENITTYKKIHKEFIPDIVITDFETSAYLYGKFLKVPIIDVDNIQVLSRCKLDIKIPSEEKFNYNLAKTICKYRVPDCNHYLLSTFFDSKIIKENTEFIPPILRNEIINAKTVYQNHILVYQTSSSQQNLTKILNEVENEKFLVYGFNIDEVKGNCILKKFSEDGFINDLATSNAVITNGGYSLISEAVYLKKPVCSFPIKNQFEQFMNAAYIEKLSYGKHLTEFNSKGISEFLDNLNIYRTSIICYTQKGNEDTFNKLDVLLSKYN
ncbi:MAG: hypothetical protein A2X08_08245 [Bacteroidetes bacterium GWA2_32_17]|nr:MAG: hypothetical protein A2X08_08245 [Bacteroidetes bacterium GWA2_32_17]